METITQNAEIKVTFNGSCTWFVEDMNGTCYKTFDSEKKAIKYFAKLSYQMGL